MNDTRRRKRLFGNTQKKWIDSVERPGKDGN